MVEWLVFKITLQKLTHKEHLPIDKILLQLKQSKTKVKNWHMNSYSLNLYNKFAYDFRLFCK